jgi:organic hydroperoxide reductase OsmC/OhrA
MKPPDLLLVSLGSCTAYDVVNILEKKRQRLAGLEVAVTGEQGEEPPWPFRKIHLHYTLRGKELKEKAVQDAIELSEKKYCSISATVRGVGDRLRVHDCRRRDWRLTDFRLADRTPSVNPKSSNHTIIIASPKL